MDNVIAKVLQKKNIPIEFTNGYSYVRTFDNLVLYSISVCLIILHMGPESSSNAIPHK